MRSRLQLYPLISNICSELLSRFRRHQMRYYFHLRHATHSIPDEQGIELPNLDETREEILTAIAELRAENPELAQESSGWRLIVSDSSGTILFSICLGERG